MERIFDAPDPRVEYRYSAHAFVTKETVRPIQAPDILAWQHATHLKRLLRGEGPRADYTALTDDQPLELRLIPRENLLHMHSQVEAVLRPILDMKHVFELHIRHREKDEGTPAGLYEHALYLADLAEKYRTRT